MKTICKQTSSKNNTLFYFLVHLTIIAYLTRIAELFPFLATLRINLLLFVTTLLLFAISGAVKNLQFRGNTAFFLMTGFLVMGILSIPFSVWPANALRTVNNTLMINMALFLFCLSVLRTEKNLYRTIHTLVFSCAILLYGLSYKPVIVEEFRVSTTITYDANDIALLFAFVFPLVVSFFVNSRFIGKIFACTIIAGLALGIIKTGSRGGMLALSIAIFLIFFSSGIGLRLFYKLAVVAMTIVFVLSPAGDSIRQRFSNLMSGKDYNIANTDSAAGGRLAIWKSGCTLILSDPLLGVGAGNSAIAMGEKYGDRGWKTMHNSYLQIAVEIGVLGLGLYLGILYTILKYCRESIATLRKVSDKHGKRLLSTACSIRIGLIAYLIAGLFLSQAFSPILPLSLALTNRLRNILDEPDYRENANANAKK